eukprot:1336990-Amorphochlora_amoeboformis.AAC.1
MSTCKQNELFPPSCYCTIYMPSALLYLQVRVLPTTGDYPLLVGRRRGPHHRAGDGTRRGSTALTAEDLPDAHPRPSNASACRDA